MRMPLQSKYQNGQLRQKRTQLSHLIEVEFKFTKINGSLSRTTNGINDNDEQTMLK